MTRTHKKIFGFLGLALVAVMTVVAANIPSPQASAINSITDTIQVRVVGDTPDVNIAAPGSDSFIDGPNLEYEITNENVEYVDIYLVVVGDDGTNLEYPIRTVFTDYKNEPVTGTIDLNAYKGYGNYILKVVGRGYDGVKDEDVVAFEYVPTKADVEYDKSKGTYTVNLQYETGVVCSARVDLYNVNDLNTSVWNTTVYPPTNSVSINMANRPAGEYKVIVTSFGCGEDAGAQVGAPYDAGNFKYEPTRTPNTGGLFNDANISKEDYLTTGLIIFFVIGIVAFAVVARNRSDKSAKRNRKK